MTTRRRVTIILLATVTLTLAAFQYDAAGSGPGGCKVTPDDAQEGTE